MNIQTRKKLVGREFNHDSFGTVRVLDLVPKSYTLVEAEVTCKGHGYDQSTGTFKGTTTTYTNSKGERCSFWSRGERGDLGGKFQVRIDELKEEVLDS